MSIVEIKLSIIRDVCYNKLESTDWELIESKITGSDEYDGGADYEAIIKNKSTGEYYKVDYQEWDMDWEKSGFEEDEETGFSIDDGNIVDAQQVFPRKVEITIYD